MMLASDGSMIEINKMMEDDNYRDVVALDWLFSEQNEEKR
jgi:hypothetical protein